MGELARSAHGALSTDLKQLDHASLQRIRESFRATNTKDAYESAWALFQRWCADVAGGAIARRGRPMLARVLGKAIWR